MDSDADVVDSEPYFPYKLDQGRRRWTHVSGLESCISIGRRNGDGQCTVSCNTCIPRAMDELKSLR